MMKNSRFVANSSCVVVFAVMASLLTSRAAVAQDISLLQGHLAVPADSPFAVGGDARKPLPPLDCWRCTGPVPCAPCNGRQQAFLYYGTFPRDDDCFNGFDDCLCGQCGSLAAGVTNGWIRWRDHCRRLLGGSGPKCASCGGHCVGACSR